MFEDYECIGQINLLDYLKDSDSSKFSKNLPEKEEELLFQVSDDTVIRFHVLKKTKRKDGFFYHCEEGNFYVPNAAFGHEFFHFGIAAEKQLKRNAQKQKG